MPDNDPLSFTSLMQLIDRLRLPELPPDATPEQRAMRLMIESGRAKLSPATMVKLKAAVDTDPYSEFMRSTESPLLGGINLIVDPTLPDDALFVVPDDRPAVEDTEKFHDWLVRWTLIRDLANAPSIPAVTATTYPMHCGNSCPVPGPPDPATDLYPCGWRHWCPWCGDCEYCYETGPHSWD